MNVIFVDDIKNILERYKMYQTKISEITHAEYFMYKEDALDYIKSNPVDIAFIDIRLINNTDKQGLELAKEISRVSPATFIIFTTDYKLYEEAFSTESNIHPFAYLPKPVSKQDIRKEIEKINVQKRGNKKEVEVRMFGYFGITVNGKQIAFKRNKSKEIIAYMISKRGAPINSSNIITNVFEGIHIEPKNIGIFMNDIRETLKTNHIEYILKNERYSGVAQINPETIECDYYDFLDSDINAINSYTGEFCGEYGEWAREIEEKLNEMKKLNLQYTSNIEIVKRRTTNVRT